MSSRTEQEEKLDAIFDVLEASFKKLERTRDEAKRAVLLKEVNTQLRDAKTLIKEFEREARTDGMPARELAERKRVLVNEFNSYVALKKGYASADEARGELLAGTSAGAGGSGGEGGGGGGSPYEGMSMQELMREGRKGMQETEQTLTRAEKLVEDTMQIGQQTAVTLHEQTGQLNKIVDDLNEIEFTMKKASRVIADITKGIMTDKCIMFLLFLVVAGVIALVVVKVINPNKKHIAEAAAAAGVNTTQIAGQIASGVTQASQQVASGLSTGVGAIGNGISGRRRRRRLFELMLQGGGDGGGGFGSGGGGSDFGGGRGGGAAPYVRLW
ncbi:hypothetical protein Rsub_01574 [Raphidocelis subcapitata]|uniref:t-SNARE coiled-coil homology domain-containing protein n=1 Tax=Raphidocelis subcapitata TaxID=307507 RepID=A0A2V0NV20_9CHLO|nr:hypothetical protein Rsub_01574 [Raphidocelis subcapitata]|eukprot:GBF88675.1 hypothetical protein Rsub_01574 [Raphidocelis subcapitata]